MLEINQGQIPILFFEIYRISTKNWNLTLIFLTLIFLILIKPLDFFFRSL